MLWRRDADADAASMAWTVRETSDLRRPAGRRVAYIPSLDSQPNQSGSQLPTSMRSSSSSSSTTTTTALLAPRPRPRPRHPSPYTMRLSLSPAPASAPLDRLRRAQSLSPAALDEKPTSARECAEAEDEEEEEENEDEEKGDDRSRLRPRRVHVASTPSPSRRTFSLSPSPSPAPSPSTPTHVLHHKKARPQSQSSAPPLLRHLRLPALRALKRKLALASASTDVDVYDTLIALAFAVCVVLFFRALSGSGSGSRDVSYPTAGAGRQAHRAYAPTREALHARAGTFCSVPLDSDSTHAVPTGRESNSRKHKPHHYTGVPPDPHAHASVDPEGSWSYALDHHLPHLHLHLHPHLHAHEHGHDAQHAWGALRERVLGLIGFGAGEGGGEVGKEDDVDGYEARQEKRERQELPERDDDDDAPEVVYPMRVHLPPSAEDGAGGAVTITKDAIQKHRKARGRSRM